MPTAVEVVRQSASCPCCAVRLDLVHAGRPGGATTPAGVGDCRRRRAGRPGHGRPDLLDGPRPAPAHGCGRPGDGGGRDAGGHPDRDRPAGLAHSTRRRPAGHGRPDCPAAADRLSPQGKESLEAALRALNPWAPVTVEYGDLLGVRSFDSQAVVARLGGPTGAGHRGRGGVRSSFKVVDEAAAATNASARLLLVAGTLTAPSSSRRWCRPAPECEPRPASSPTPGPISWARPSPHSRGRPTAPPWPGHHRSGQRR